MRADWLDSRWCHRGFIWRGRQSTTTGRCFEAFALVVGGGVSFVLSLVVGCVLPFHQNLDQTAHESHQRVRMDHAA